MARRKATQSSATMPPTAERSLTGMRNLGPVSARRLKSVGITTPQHLEATGAVEAYKRVAKAFPNDTSLVLLYALEGALSDVHWNSLPPQVKAQLRRQAGRP
jgi:DNA transformation protein and related proteins